MSELSIQIKLLSEMIFGSGECVPGFIDLEVLHDENGLPYFKGKTFKGKLREEAENIVNNIMSFNETLGRKLANEEEMLFGIKGIEDPMTIKFSDCTLGEDVINCIKYGIGKNKFTAQEVLNSMTVIRSFTSIDETGTADEGSLRQFRVINRGFIFICKLYTEKELDDTQIGLLACSTSILRHLGTMESRGKGEVECSLFKDGVNITQSSIKTFREKVI